MSGRSMRAKLVPLDEQMLRSIPVSTGVYQICDANGDLVDIGVAGGHASFGLRGALREWLTEHGDHSWQVRWEVAKVYLPRWHELLMDRVAETGELPAMLQARGVGAPGRLRPR